jgi:predicted transposase YdaD
MSHPFDATLKDIVAERPADFAPLHKLPREQLRPLNVDLSTISAATDVALGVGDPVREIVDLNFQSGLDPKLPGRLHLYNAALFARYDVPVRTVAVLLRPKADGPNLSGNLSYGEPGGRVEFEYEVVRLWRQPAEVYLRAGLAALPLATLCAMPEDKPLVDALKDVVREIDGRLASEATHADAVRLMVAAYILTGLRVPKNELSAIYRGVGLMQESTAFDEIVEESERRGELRGEIKRSHRLLLRLGRNRFGSPDAAAEAQLTSIDDLDRLDRLADAIFTAASWQELLATP